MASAVLRKTMPASIEITRPISVGALAKHLGIPRQRVYNMVRRGEIKTVNMTGGMVITPQEAVRVLEAATHIDTKGGQRLAFEFV